jgi:hypothetical protein
METNVEQPFFTDEVINQLISITTEKGIMSFLLDNLKIFLNRYPQDLEVHSSINDADAHYRVSVSAHGTDMVVMHNPAVSTGSSVEFLFQQPRHNCSAFAYSGLLPRIEKTFCDFRTMLYQCMSKIIFSKQYIRNASAYNGVMKFQELLFNRLHQDEYRMHTATYNTVPDNIIFGNPFRHRPFQSFGHRHSHFTTPIQRVCRRYDLDPGFIVFNPPSGTNQLEYTDSTKTRVVLVRGLTLSAHHIDMAMDAKIPGIEVNIITNQYGIYVDTMNGNKVRFNVDIFDLLDELHFTDIGKKRTRASKSSRDDHNSTADTDTDNDLVKIKKRRHEDTTTNVKSTSLLKQKVFNLFLKYGLLVEEEKEYSFKSADDILDLVFELVHTGNAIIPHGVDATDTVGRFLKKYNGNLCELRSTDEIDQLCKRTTVDILKGWTSDPFVIFVRKVFLLDVISKHLPSKHIPPITSDQIISILLKHAQGQNAHIQFFDQTCRNCSTAKCMHLSTGGRKFKKTNRKGTKGKHMRKKNKSKRFHRKIYKNKCKQ